MTRDSNVTSGRGASLNMCGTGVWDGLRGLTFDMRGGRQPAKLDVGRPLDGRVRALVFVHEAHRLGLFSRPPAYAELPAVREPAHEWSGKGLNCLTARRSTAARSANNGLTLLRLWKRGGTDAQELLCNLTGRGDHLTFVRSPCPDGQTTCDRA